MNTYARDDLLIACPEQHASAHASSTREKVVCKITLVVTL